MKKSEIAAVNEFVVLIGGKNWVRTSCRCTGKWSGTTDYGFVMDGRVTFFVSNGMSYFEQRVREWIKAIKTFRAKKESYLRLLREQVEKDNAHAKAEGLQSVRLIEIGIVSPECGDSYDFFAPYALIEVGGRQFKHHTTNFACAIMNDELETYLDDRNSKKIFTAAAIDNPDYIFCGVRFSSTANLYKIGR